MKRGDLVVRIESECLPVRGGGARKILLHPERVSPDPVRLDDVAIEREHPLDVAKRFVDFTLGEQRLRGLRRAMDLDLVFRIRE